MVVSRKGKKQMNKKIMQIAELLAEIEYIARELPAFDKETISCAVMNVRMRNNIKSGVYAVAECKVAERNKT